MIQKIVVTVTRQEHCDEVCEALEMFGISKRAVRIVPARQESGNISVAAYIDRDFDRFVDPKTMDDFCAETWSRIGFARISFEEYGRRGDIRHWDKSEFDAWQSI